MPALKSYLIRAIYQWINDCDLTPYLLINADNDQAILPMDFVENGTIVLNIRPSAVQNLALENDHITFDASFHGKSMQVHAPINAVLSIFAKENGEGMFFDPPEDKDSEVRKDEKKPMLRVIK